MEETQKIEILLSVLNIRNEDLRDMRNRVLNIVTASATLFMLFVGWIVQSKTTPNFLEILLLSCIIAVFWIGNILILRNLSKGFINTQQTIIRIEESLLLHQPKAFTNDDTPLLPESWRKTTNAAQFRRYQHIITGSALAVVAKTAYPTTIRYIHIALHRSA